jgi:RimJ/RimL family protein N-acetyltransferase
MNKKKCEDIIHNLKMNGTCFMIDGGYLVTIPFDYLEKMPECVELLSRWRIENPSLSPQRFPVSYDRTNLWLKKCVLDADNRIMFMIQNNDRRPIGHIGLSGFNYDKSMVRIDSVMRGVKNNSPGIVGNSIEFLKGWCKDVLDVKCMDLVVLDDNEKAITLYQRCGFKCEKKIPLKKIEKNGEINWIEDYGVEKPEKQYINMLCVVDDDFT